MTLRSKLVASVALGCMASMPALAQDEAAGDGEESAADDQIRIVGFRSSLASSLEAKRDANQVLDAITAEEIGQFADQNIAEAIQRISGVQIQRLNGEGSTVSIRGLEPLYTRVEIDGRTGVGGGADSSRETQLQFFTSDIFNTITVVKSPTAADVEGGIGGIVRLETADPLDLGTRSVAISAQLADADQRDETEPTYQGLFSDVFMDGRLGLLVFGSYLERDAGLDQIQNNQNWLLVDEGDLADDTDPALLALVGGRYPGRLRQEQEAGDRERINLNAKLQFMATPELELFFGGLYSQEDETLKRNRIQIQWSRGDIESGVLDPSTGTITEATFTGQRSEFRSFLRGQDNLTWGFNTGADWDHGPWRIFGELSYQYNEVSLDETRASHRTNSDDLGGYSIVDDPEFPVVFTAATELARDEIGIRDLDREDRVVENEDFVARIDAERTVDLPLITSFEFGGRYNEATTLRRQQIANSVLEGEGAYALGDPLIENDPFAAGFGPTNLLREWPNLDPVGLFEANAIDGVEDSQRRYDISEETFALYALVNYEAEPAGWFARGNAGVRLVNTQYEGEGRVFLTTADGDDLQTDEDTPTLDGEYTEVLPAFNVVISPSQESNVQFRGAVTRALSRPRFDQILPVLELSLEDTEGDLPSGSSGNPDLNPYLAWQYDLGVEYYFAEDAAITFGLFYKDIEEFISGSGSTVERVVVPSLGLDQDFSISRPENGGDATVQGFEVSIQAPFSFLPEPFNGAGALVNYTYTDSEFTNAAGITEPFPGSSENAFNLVGYYERGGFSTRLAYNYRDEFVVEPFQTDGDTANQEITDAQGRLDLAVRYRFENGLRLSFDALNLTEEQTYIFYDTPDRLENIEVEGRIYQFRIGYTY